MIDLDSFPGNETALRMMSRVSPIYDDSYIAKWLFEVMGNEMGQARNFFEELRQQVVPEMATWGLDYWEQRYHLPTDQRLTLEDRRVLIIKKRGMRAPINPAKLEKIIEDITGARTVITENVAPYTFSVELFPNSGTGLYNRNLGRVLKSLKPSHLSFFITAEIFEAIQVPIRAIVKEIAIKTGISVFGLDEVRFDGMYNFDGTRIFTSLFSRGPRVPKIELRTTLDMWEMDIPLLNGTWMLNGSKILGLGNRRGPQLQSVDFTLHTAMDSWGVRGAAWRLETGVNMFGVKTFYFDGANNFDAARIFTSEFETGPHVPKIELTKNWRMLPKMDMNMDFTAGCVMNIRPAAKLEMATGINAGGIAQMQRMDMCTGIHAGPECSTSMTYDTMWLLDGGYTLDGSRKLNADIITENI